MRGPHANPYADSEGVTNVGETPFRRARQEWDSRIGEAVHQAENWRRACFLVGCGMLLAIGGSIYLGSLPRRVPVIVEVDRDGVATVRGEVGAEAGAFEPSGVQVRYWVELFVTSWRRNSSDVGIVKLDEMQAYALATPNVHGQLKSYFAELGDPLTRSRSGVVKLVELVAIQITASTWQVDWTEARWKPPQPEPTHSRWRGLIRAQHRKNQKFDPKNPLAIFVEEFHWEKVR